MSRKRNTSNLTTAEWGIIEPLIPPAKARGRPRTIRMREVVNAIFYVLNTVCQGANLPGDFRRHSTVFDYDTQWRRNKVWQELNAPLREAIRWIYLIAPPLLIDLLTQHSTLGQSSIELQLTDERRVSTVVFDVEWSADGEFIAYADNTGAYLITPDLAEILDLSHSVGTRMIDWSPDSARIVGGRSNGTLQIWQRNDQDVFVLERTLQGQQDEQIAAGWSPDGRWIVSLAGTVEISGLRDITGYLWNTETWQLERTLDETYIYDGLFPLSIEWTSDSRHVVFAGYSSEDNGSHSINIYDVTSGERVERYSTIEYPHSIALNPLDNGLIAAGSIRDIELVHRDHMSVAPFLNANPSNHIVRDMEWSSDGRWLAFGNLGGWITIFDPARGIAVWSHRFVSDTLVTGIQWRPDGTELLTVAREGNDVASTFQLWDVSDLPDLSGTPTLTPRPTRTATPTPAS